MDDIGLIDFLIKYLTTLKTKDVVDKSLFLLTMGGVLASVAGFILFIYRRANRENIRLKSENVDLSGELKTANQTIETLVAEKKKLESETPDAYIARFNKEKDGGNYDPLVFAAQQFIDKNAEAHVFAQTILARDHIAHMAEDGEAALYNALAAVNSGLGCDSNAQELQSLKGELETQIQNLSQTFDPDFVVPPPNDSAPEDLPLDRMGFIAGKFFAAGAYGLAATIYSRLLMPLARKIGPEHPDVLTANLNLAVCMDNQGEHEAAEYLFRDLIPSREAILGKDHPDVLVAYNNLVSCLLAQWKLEEAERLCCDLIPRWEAALGKDHRVILMTHQNLATCLNRQKKHEAAEQIFRDLIPRRHEALGKDHPHVLTTYHNLAVCMNIQGKYAGAEQLFRDLIPRREAALGKDHPDALFTLRNLAHCLRCQEKDEEAAEIDLEIARREGAAEAD